MGKAQKIPLSHVFLTEKTRVSTPIHQSLLGRWASTRDGGTGNGERRFRSSKSGLHFHMKPTQCLFLKMGLFALNVIFFGSWPHAEITALVVCIESLYLKVYLENLVEEQPFQPHPSPPEPATQTSLISPCGGAAEFCPAPLIISCTCRFSFWLYSHLAQWCKIPVKLAAPSARRGLHSG